MTAGHSPAKQGYDKLDYHRELATSHLPLPAHLPPTELC